jgi:hypothetical protein
MKPDEPRKELKPEELITAMVDKTIRTVKSTEVDHLHIEFTDGTEVELKAENFCYIGDPAIVGYSPIYLNSRDIANMPLENDIETLLRTGIYSKNPERTFFKIDPQSNFSKPSD